MTLLPAQQAVTLASVVWSALRIGSNADTFLGTGSAAAAGAAATEQPLLGRQGDEEEGTSAGLDGEAPRQQPPMSAGAELHGFCLSGLSNKYNGDSSIAA